MLVINICFICFVSGRYVLKLPSIFFNETAIGTATETAIETALKLPLVCRIFYTDHLSYPTPPPPQPDLLI